ncbi:hypothetical protein TNCV_2322861 [Trichonephila clavipes]|nr:hypothetical protein TNCV_2322861 [Trichonephila clavipes]
MTPRKDPFSKKTEGILSQFDFRTNSFNFLPVLMQTRQSPATKKSRGGQKVARQDDQKTKCGENVIYMFVRRMPAQVSKSVAKSPRVAE